MFESRSEEGRHRWLAMSARDRGFEERSGGGDMELALFLLATGREGSLSLFAICGASVVSATTISTFGRRPGFECHILPVESS